MEAEHDEFVAAAAAATVVDSQCTESEAKEVPDECSTNGVNCYEPVRLPVERPDILNASVEIEEGELPADQSFEEPARPSDGESQLAVPKPACKPVLGKEKAKQRLKALGKQKKLQMESRTPTKNAKLKTGVVGEAATTPAGRSAGANGSKREKLMTPHQKAQHTIDEIEVMKREEDNKRVKVPVCIYETMIHRITADSYDENKPNSSQVATVTSSLEAIKCYDDDGTMENGTQNQPRRHKRAKPEAYRRRRRSSTASLQASKRKSKSGRRERSGQRDTLSGDRNRDSTRQAKRDKRRSRDENTTKRRSSLNKRPSSFATRPTNYRSDIFQDHGTIRYTRTKPVISFACNPLTNKFKSKVKKSKKKQREETISAEDGAAKKRRKDKRKKKKRSTKKDEDTTPATVSSKKKRKKSAREKRPPGPPPAVGMLSFAAEDMNFEIDECSSTAKAPVEPNAEIRALDLEAEQIITAAAVATAKTTNPVPESDAGGDETSPDTDDYMPNWEEDDEEESSKDAAVFPLRKDTLGELARDSVSPSSRSSSVSNESVKDGLGTPIFVNPSPPKDFLESMTFDDDFPASAVAVQVEDATTTATEEEEEESLTPPAPTPKHLFEMENLYEQFLHSVREDPDFLDQSSRGQQSVSPNEPNASINDSSHDEGFLSEPTTTPTRTASFASPRPDTTSTSSDRSSEDDSAGDGDDTEDVEKRRKVSPRKRKKKTKRRKKPPSEAEPKPENEKAEAETASETDDFIDIAPDDLKKLRSLQKRRNMLKMIRQQIDGMDEEDRQCLLGLQKLIRAERLMLLRNEAIRHLHEKKNILGTDSEDSSSTPEPTAALQTSSESDLIFDENRETIKLTITSKNPTPIKKLPTVTRPTGTATDAAGDEDQDFTERLMKSKTKFKYDDEKTSSRGSSSTNRRFDRRSRSFSASPDRRSRTPPKNRSSNRPRNRAYTPSPTRSSSRRHSNKSSSSSSRRRHSKSPDRSPPCRSSRSPARNQSSSSRSVSHSPPPHTLPLKDTTTVSMNSYPMWDMDRYPQYYIGDSFYYPRVPPISGATDGKDGAANARYPASYEAYTSYNLYPNDYTDYTGDYANHAAYPGTQSTVGTHPDNTDSGGNAYLSIPVIGSTTTGAPSTPTSDTYFFGDNNAPSGVDIHHPETDSKNLNVKPFAVQKGNVLEIVPAATITPVAAQEVGEIKVAESARTVDGDKPAAEESESSPDESTKAPSTDVKAEVSPRKNISWKNEVARRHVVSAVMRLNKESDEGPRGILKNKANMPIKEKKKVLFADGIPPGRSSSASSDEEATLKFIRKRIRKKHRRMMSENKENEVLATTDPLTAGSQETKIDPELWNAPPPPPPPGSPPPHLPQPELVRPPSPQELLYFHFDPVYNLMYVSPMENAVPPRLLQNNGKTVAAKLLTTPVTNPTTTTTTTVTPSPDTTSNMENGDVTPESTISKNPSPPQHVTISLENGNSPHNSPDLRKVKMTPPQQLQPQREVTASPVPVPPPAISKPSSPPQPIQNIINIRLNNNNSPQFYQQATTQQQTPVCFESPQQSQQLPSQPIMVGYPGQIFNRNTMPPTRRSSPNIIRGLYNRPPPHPIHHRAFNPHVPPPFTTPPPHSANLNGPMPPQSQPLPPPPPPQQSTVVVQSGYDASLPGGPFNPNLIMFNSPRPPLPGSPVNFAGYRMTPPQNSSQSSLAASPHMLMPRPPNNRFGSTTMTPTSVSLSQQFLDRNSPTMGSSHHHLFRLHPPPIPGSSGSSQPPPPPQQQQQSLAPIQTSQ